MYIYITDTLHIPTQRTHTLQTTHTPRKEQTSQDPKKGELCRHMLVVASSDTDVQIVRYIPLSSFPSGQLELNNFHQVKRMICGIGNMLFSTYSQNSKWVRMSGYFGEHLVQMTHVALSCLNNCLSLGNQVGNPVPSLSFSKNSSAPPPRVICRETRLAALLRTKQHPCRFCPCQERRLQCPNLSRLLLAGVDHALAPERVVLWISR